MTRDSFETTAGSAAPVVGGTVVKGRMENVESGNRSSVRVVVKRICAYVLLVAGVAGLAVPLLPGIPLLLVGLKLLGPEHPIRQTLARWITRTPSWMKRRPGRHE